MRRAAVASATLVAVSVAEWDAGTTIQEATEEFSLTTDASTLARKKIGDTIATQRPGARTFQMSDSVLVASDPQAANTLIAGLALDSIKYIGVRPGLTNTTAAAASQKVWVVKARVLAVDPEPINVEDGNYYAVPFRSDFWVVYYNKDIFDQAGIEYPTNDMTMADFDAKIREVYEKTGIYGNIYHTWRSTTTLFGILDGKNTVIDGNYDFLKPYYEQVMAEQTDGVIPNYGEQKTANLHYSGAFENGQAAMCNMGSWFIATLQKYNAEASANGVQPVNFGIVKYPHPDGAPAGSTLGTVTSLAVNANSEKKEAALDFVNWCASEDGAKCVAAVGTFPAVASDETNKIISSTDGFPSDDASLEALNTTAIYLEMPLSDKASEIETILNTEHDAIMTESETVDEGIANMNEQVQALLG